MKNLILYSVAACLIWYVVTVHMVSNECREHLGWEYYAVFPEPTCHGGLQVAPLDTLPKNRIKRTWPKNL